MLKIIEEPNDRIMFIFLTSNKEDIISTIVSRSQCFNISKGEREDFSFESIKPIFQNYWNFERSKVFDISQTLINLTKEIPADKILEEMQNYILSILKSNPYNISFIDDIKQIETAKKEINLGMNPQNVFDNLCLKLIK